MLQKCYFNKLNIYLIEWLRKSNPLKNTFNKFQTRPTSKILWGQNLNTKTLQASNFAFSPTPAWLMIWGGGSKLATILARVAQATRFLPAHPCASGCAKPRAAERKADCAHASSKKKIVWNSHGALGDGHVEVAEDHVGVLIGAVVLERVAHAHGVGAPAPRRAHAALLQVVHAAAVGRLHRHQVWLAHHLHCPLAEKRHKNTNLVTVVTWN